METISKNHKYGLFSAFGLFFLGLDLFGIILSLAGIFHLALIITYLIVGIATISLFAYKSRKSLETSKTFLFVASLSIVFIIFLSFFATPTVFSGRDQGSFSEAAIKLSQNHKLGFSSNASEEFFKIHGVGLAQNFPGFNYASNGELVPHFSLGYIAWLAVFFSLFGLKGLFIANAVSFIIFIFSFYVLARIFLKKSAPVIVLIILILTSFIFSWFLKFTLGENLALGFLWFGIAQAAIFFQHKNRINLSYSFLSLIILAFSRLETWSFIFMFLAIIFSLKRKKKTGLDEFFDKKTIIALAVIVTVYLINIYVNNPFYIASLKGLLKSFSFRSVDPENSIGMIHVFRTLSTYALFAPFSIGIVGALYLLKKKIFAPLLPIAIILPAFIYIIHPGISSDHPWMLRRFVFSITPAIIFTSIFFLYSFFKKKLYFYLLTAILIISSLFPSLPFLTYSENKNLLPETEMISRNFSSSDLILVDRLASGNGWSMISGPLDFIFGKQAVYFFDPKDLAKIDKSKFSNIYFIIPDSNIAFYAQDNIIEKLVPIKDYSLTDSSLSISDSFSTMAFSLPQKSERIIRGKIYLLKQ